MGRIIVFDMVFWNVHQYRRFKYKWVRISYLSQERQVITVISDNNTIC